MDKAAGLTLPQGTAMYVGAVLGTGVISLPALAVRAAGPASLIAWVALIVASVPLAASYAALAARLPDAGGVSTYVRRAFGAWPATVVGWCFYAVVPVGAPAAAIFGASYVTTAAGGGRAGTLGIAAGLIAVVAVANALGVQVSAKLQLVLTGVLAALLVAAVASSAHAAHTANLHPFAPHGWTAIWSAAALLVWSLAGWEAVTHLAPEFRRPRRDLPRSTVLALIIVGVLYLAVAAATVLVLGAAAGNTKAPLAELLAIGFGGPARGFAAAAAVLLTLGVMNAYFAGAANLGAALGRDGAMPAWLAVRTRRGGIPQRSLFVMVALALLSLLGVTLSGADTGPLVLATAGLVVAVNALGMAAAVALLPGRSLPHRIAIVALIISVALLLGTGRYLAVPFAVALAAWGYLGWRTRRRRTQISARPATRLNGCGNGADAPVVP